jgi:hypothetical protein
MLFFVFRSIIFLEVLFNYFFVFLSRGTLLYIPFFGVSSVPALSVFVVEITQIILFNGIFTQVSVPFVSFFAIWLFFIEILFVFCCIFSESDLWLYYFNFWKPNIFFQAKISYLISMGNSCFYICCKRWKCFGTVIRFSLLLWFIH